VPFRRWLEMLALTGAVALAVLSLREAGFLVGTELQLHDHFVRRGVAEGGPSPRLLIVEITEEDIREQGHWPLSDRSLALALERLLAAPVLAVGLDLYRDLPVPPGEARFAKVLREEPRVIGVRKFGAVDRDGIEPPSSLVGSERVGFNDVLLDADAYVRRALLFQDDGGDDFGTAFSLRLAMMALAAEGIRPEQAPEDIELMRLGETTLVPLESRHGGYRNLDASGYQLLLDYSAPSAAPSAGGFERVTLGALLRGEVPESLLAGRVVLIGSNAKSLPDLFAVPLGGTIPGVALHAHVVDQILRLAHGESLPVQALAEWQEQAFVVLAAALACALMIGLRATPSFGASLEVGIGGLGLVILYLVALLARDAGLWLPIVGPALAWGGVLAMLSAWLLSRDRAERAVLMGLFSRHVSADVAEELWKRRDEFFEQGRPKPQRLPVTVLFIDMKGYSRTAATLEPPELMEWINDFLELMAGRVSEYGGVVNDYYGDGLMAQFGVPIPRASEAEISADAQAAVRCAIAMSRSLVELNARYAAQGLAGIGMRVGLATGDAVAGSIGSSDRLKYTIVGEVAVIAQRLEATDRVEHDFDLEPCRILASEETVKRLGDGFETRDVGVVELAGYGARISTHRILATEHPL
jgi:adenylate cyclase